eukprot:jgi/Pico_ML_1/54214/g4620.t1
MGGRSDMEALRAYVTAPDTSLNRADTTVLLQVTHSNLKANFVDIRRSTVRLGRALSKRMAVLGGDQYGWALLTSWVLTVAYQTLFFCVAATFKFDKVTDFAGGTNFVVVALVSLFFGGLQSARQIVVTVLVSTWGARLSLFLLFRILLWGEDRRFDDKRDNLVTFAAFWIFQAVWVWIVTIPVVVLNGGGGAVLQEQMVND